MIKNFNNTKIVVLICLMVSVGIILSGCDRGNVLGEDLVYKYSGSIGVGDFVDVEINLTDKTYRFTNRITAESSSGTFRKINNSFYEITAGNLTGNKFTILDDQVLIASVNEAKEGERLITALKSANKPYGAEIGGNYNVATSLEGWVGMVTIDPANSIVEVKLDKNGDANYDGANETYPPMSYTFDQEFNAIKIVENDEFRHFGVFLNNDVGIFDCYMWDGTDWVGDGMFVLVKQQLGSVNLLNYAGKYTYIDVDADYGTFELVPDGENLSFLVDGEDTELTFIQADVVDGIISFEANLAGAEDGTLQTWNFMFLPGQVIIVASSDEIAFGGEGDGGFAIGVKSNQ